MALVLFTPLLVSNCTTMPKPHGTPTLGKDTWRSYDGKEMPWRVNEVPQGKSLRAVVITVHGLSGAASDFWPLGENWPQKGIAVYGMELRGQGNDPEKKSQGDIAGAEVWEKDLSTFHRLVQERHPDLPVIWYSESLGTLIALHALADSMVRQAPQALIISSPAAGLKMKPRIGKLLLVRAAIKLAPRAKVNLERLAGVKDADIQMTEHSTHEAQMAMTPHHVPEFTLRLLGEVEKMIRRLPKAAQQATLPVLVLASPNDVIASPGQVKDFYDHLCSKDKTIHWYERSYHLLLHDVQRWEVLEDATKWIEQRLKK